MFRRFVAVIMIVALLVVVVVYRDASRRTSESPITLSTPIPLTFPGYDRDAAYVAAQATLAAGQSALWQLDEQATVASLNRRQAANAAAQATVDANERRLMDLSIRATEIGQNMARAAVTQQFVVEQAQIAWNATAASQSQATTFTYTAHILGVTQLARRAQADATRTAYSLTATPLAAIQADIDRTQGEAARRAWWDEFVFTPLTAFLILLIALLLIAGGVLAYLRLMPLLELRLRTTSHIHDSPMLLVNGTVVDRHRRLSPRRPSQAYLPPGPHGSSVEVEVIGPSEPSITNWITEAERQLRGDGWI